MLEPNQYVNVKWNPNNINHYRSLGYKFTKFGGGTKTLKNYLIDKKIPLRIRESLPVLASGSEILCIFGVEISDKVRLDDTTKFAYVITGKSFADKK